MLLIILLTAILILFFMMAGVAFNEDQPGAGLGCLLIGIFFLFLMHTSSPVPKDGSPAQTISAGHNYKIAFIYPAGENVSVGLELPYYNSYGKLSAEHLYLYQFGKNAFDGEVNLNAKKLVVIETGSFKKLRLE